jgi:predicted dithiol-disulfide oxidoreductase (DUF899 family)
MSSYGFPHASPEYRKLRDELLEAEIALKDQRERVAALRRRLPVDTVVENYVLQEGPRDLAAGDDPVVDVRLSELFERQGLPLVLVHFMFGGQQKEPCPMCTLWADGYDGAVPHLRERMNFGVLVGGNLAEFRSYARERGWRHLRLLCAGASQIKSDVGTQSADGRQAPGVSVFTLAEDGDVRHFYSGGAFLAEGHFRGMDLLSPVWNFLDLTPAGRGDWMPSRSYASK